MGPGIKSKNSQADLSKINGITPVKSSNNLKGSIGNLEEILNKRPSPPSANNLHQFNMAELKKPCEDVVAFIDLNNFKT